MNERKIRITTETMSNIPPGLLGAILPIVPAFINWKNGTIERQDSKISLKEIHDLFNQDEVIKTSIPGLGLFAQGFAAVPDENVLHIASGSKLTGMHDNAVAGAKLLNEEKNIKNITVFDSQTTSIGTGLVALEAEKLALEGKNAEEIVKYLTDDFLPRLHVLDCVESIYYPLLGGRVQELLGKMTQLLGITLNDEAKTKIEKFIIDKKNQIKPLKGLLKIQQNKIKVETITFNLRALRKNMVERILGLGELESVIITYFDAENEVRIMADRIEKETGVKPTIVEVSSAIAVHNGPGSIGIAAVQKTI